MADDKNLNEKSKRLSEIVEKLKEENAQLQFQETLLSRANKLASETLNIRKGETFANTSKIKSLQQEAALQLKNLDLLKNKGKFSKDENKELDKQIDKIKQVQTQLNKVLEVDKQLNNQLGVGRQALSQLDGIASRLGLPNLGLGQAYQNTMMMGQAAKAAGLPFDAVKTYSSQLSLNISKAFSFAALLGGAIKLIADVFLSVDKATGNLAKNFDMTYQGATKTRQELTDIANSSMDVAVTTKGLQESMVAIGQALGVNAQLNEKDLITFTKLREQAGYTNEELVAIQRISMTNQKSAEDTSKAFLGTVARLNAQNKLSINAKQLFKDIANVSDAIKLSIGGTAAKLAEAAFKARQFGINLQQADKISESLLDFEQSLANELSAELITGKDLNFERARLLAINGDVAGASAEILKQVKGSAEFTNMNRIQQEAIAKAVGMSRDDLAKSLVDREAAAKLGAKEGQSAQDRYNELVKIHGVEKANEMLGNEALERQFQQNSIQERFAQSIEKLKEVFVSLVTPLLPVLDVFTQIFKIVGPIAGVVGQIVGFMSPLLKPLLAIYGVWKGIGLLINGINFATKLQISYQGVLNNLKTLGNTLTLGMFSLQTRQNAAAAVELATENGKISAKQLSIILENESLAVKTRAYAMAAKDFILEKGSLAFKYIRNGLEIAYNATKRIGSAIAKSDLLLNIGSAMMRVIQSLASIPIVGWALGIAAAGTVAALGYKFMKGDDVMSESGYGNRTLLTPKGSIALNDKDTVIAGTNLFPSKKGDDVISSPKGSINTAPPPPPPPPQPIIIENSMDGTKFGTAVAMSKRKIN